MEYKEVKEEKEINDLKNYIKEIEEQLRNPNNEKIRKLIKDIQTALKEETTAYELIQAQGNLKAIRLIDDIDINVLYSKLPDYKQMCENKLSEKIAKRNIKNN